MDASDFPWLNLSYASLLKGAREVIAINARMNDSDLFWPHKLIILHFVEFALCGISTRQDQKGKANVPQHFVGSEFMMDTCVQWDGIHNWI